MQLVLGVKLISLSKGGTSFRWEENKLDHVEPQILSRRDERAQRLRACMGVDAWR